MANQPDDQVVSYFPEPPPFYKQFTPENLTRLQQIKDEATTDHAGHSSSPSLSADQLLSLPTELRYLVPPEPPAPDDEFRVFGESTKLRGGDAFASSMAKIKEDVENSEALVNWEYRQLYPESSSTQTESGASVDAQWSTDRRSYLFRFLRSILLNFVELLGLLALNPASGDADQRLKDILTLVANMHALINEYRPHQARETLINLMQEQLEKKKAEVEGIKKMKEKVQQTLEGFAREAPERAASAPLEHQTMTSEERRRVVQRDTWDVLDEMK